MVEKKGTEWKKKDVVILTRVKTQGDINLSSHSCLCCWKTVIFFHQEASLVAQMVKNLPAMWETWVQSLGWEDPLEEGMATHSSILAWRIPMVRGAWWATVHGVTESDTTERLSTAQQCLHLDLNPLLGNSVTTHQVPRAALDTYLVLRLRQQVRTVPLPQCCTNLSLPRV